MPFMGDEPGGLTVTSSSEMAQVHYLAAVDLMLAGRTDVDDSINAALAHDEHMVLALVLQSLRVRLRGQIEQGAAILRSAGVAAQAATDRERGVVAFFEAFIRPDRFETERRGLDHLRAYPRDRLVVLYMHFLYNIMLPTKNRRDRHRALALEHAADWGDDWFLLGEQAFIATEAGEHAESRTLAERALTARPENAPAAHAMAHALLETGAASEGRDWLGNWLEDWGGASTSRCHLTWHLALLELADDDSVAAARRLDAILDEANPPLGALSDGASLMWRLHLEGWPEPLPWLTLEHSPVPPGLVFGALHRAFVLAGLGRSAVIRSNADAMNGVIAEACRALADFADGDANATADRLLEHEADLVTIGGSRAQLEVLDDTLITALSRSGRVNAATERLQARLARRPSLRDRRWHATIAV
jgi:hypothetical protein